MLRFRVVNILPFRLEAVWSQDRILRISKVFELDSMCMNAGISLAFLFGPMLSVWPFEERQREWK
jgi:hypothetical protein